MHFEKSGLGRGHGHRAMKMMIGRGFGRHGFGGGDFRGGGRGGWQGDGDGSPPGRGGRGRMFGQGELRLFVLHLLADADRHGYELIKAIETMTGGEYAPSPGVVYPTLALLVDEGLIAEVPGEGARKAFTLTEAGSAELAARAGEADAIAQRLAALAEARGRESHPPVRRAIANLMVALRQRAAAGLDTEAAHQIADILDEAARKVERL